VLDVQRDKAGRVGALEKALTFDIDDTVLRHQYGVALSRVGREREAVDQFSKIIAVEESRSLPRDTLVMALTTRIINLRRLGRSAEAEADIARARQIIAQHPHLSHVASKLDELDLENAS
jgi:Flp pilus assembly protein TadD